MMDDENVLKLLQLYYRYTIAFSHRNSQLFNSFNKEKLGSQFKEKWKKRIVKDFTGSVHSVR